MNWIGAILTVGHDLALGCDTMKRARARRRRAAERFRDVFCRLSPEVVEHRVLPTTFLVTNTDDSGAGSLRAAITDANQNPGPNLVDFDLLPVASPTVDYDPMYQQWTIDVDSPLPAITGPGHD